MITTIIETERREINGKQLKAWHYTFEKWKINS